MDKRNLSEADKTTEIIVPEDGTVLVHVESSTTVMTIRDWRRLQDIVRSSLQGHDMTLEMQAFAANMIETFVITEEV